MHQYAPHPRTQISCTAFCNKKPGETKEPPLLNKKPPGIGLRIPNAMNSVIELKADGGLDKFKIIYQ